MNTSATLGAIAVSVAASDATYLGSRRLRGWTRRSMKTRKQRAAHKRRQKIAKASKRRNR